jgi:hypothetical protein
MNRAARRAAAARLRGRRTGYVHRLVAARTSGALPTPGVHHVIVEHDRACAIYRGAGCTCVPDITTTGPNGVVVIDELGNGRRVVKQ